MKRPQSGTAIPCEKTPERHTWLAYRIFPFVLAPFLALGPAQAQDASVLWYPGGTLTGISCYSNFPLATAAPYPNGGGQASVEATLSQCTLGTSLSDRLQRHRSEATIRDVLTCHVNPGNSSHAEVTIKPYVRHTLEWNHTTYIPEAVGVKFGLSVDQVGSANFATNVDYEYYMSDPPPTLNHDKLNPILLRMANMDRVTVSWTLVTDVNGVAGSAESTGWYTVDVSTNGYLTTASGIPSPTSPAVAFEGIEVFGTNVVLRIAGAPTNGTFSSCCLLTSTNADRPPGSWANLVTNHLATCGHFTNSVAVDAGTQNRFFRLVVLP